MLSLVRTTAASKDPKFLDICLSLGIAGILKQVRRTPFERTAIIHAVKQLAVRTSNRPHVPLPLQDCCNRDVYTGRVLQQLRLISAYQISNAFSRTERLSDGMERLT